MPTETPRVEICANCGRPMYWEDNRKMWFHIAGNQYLCRWGYEDCDGETHAEAERKQTRLV